MRLTGERIASEGGDGVTDQKDYQRKWKQEHREQIKIRDKESARRRALEDVESVKNLENGWIIVTTKDGGEYVIGQPKKGV